MKSSSRLFDRTLGRLFERAAARGPAGRPGARGLLFAAALACVAMAGFGPARDARADDAGPDALVSRVTNEVLEAIRADKDLQSGNVPKLLKLVDTKVMPSLDFEKMTRMAVGKDWRGASADQRSALVQEFHVLLTRTYAGAMAQANDKKLEIKPSHYASTDTDVIVHTQVVGTKGDPIQLDYHMEKSPTGWKVYDVNVLGVWLVETYRPQFAQQISQGGIDGLIKSLRDQNHSNAKAG